MGRQLLYQEKDQPLDTLLENLNSYHHTSFEYKEGHSSQKSTKKTRNKKKQGKNKSIGNQSFQKDVNVISSYMYFTMQNKFSLAGRKKSKQSNI